MIEAAVIEVTVHGVPLRGNHPRPNVYVPGTITHTSLYIGLFVEYVRERSLLYICKVKYQVSQKAGLTGLYKNFVLMSTTAISKPGFQEVDGTVIHKYKE